ncbi:hypothetical protein [Shimia sp.]|uniref:hypothetical protein n=1 Tax=Shimia sp. TaxID=1954381 RepID=UPI003BAAFBEB
MAEQRLQPLQSTSNLKVSRNFQAAYGGNSRAAVLAEVLGVTQEAFPQLAKEGQQKAYEDGLQQRIQGAKREDVKADGPFGFLFTQGAQDGFDYQDATLAAIEFQNEELLDFEAQNFNSRSPEDFQAWVAGREKRLAETLNGKSDVYSRVFSEAALENRMQIMEMHQKIVLGNRADDRRRSAAAAAKAATLRKKSALDAAAIAAYQLGADDDGLTFDDQEAFVKGATDAFGITTSEAKQLLVDEAITLAKETNNEGFLDTFNRQFYSREQWADLVKNQETVRQERVRIEDAEYKAADREEKRRIKLETSELASQLDQAVRAGQTREVIQDIARNSPLAARDIAKSSEMARVYAGTYDDETSTVEAAQNLDLLKELAAEASFTGDWSIYESYADQFQYVPRQLKSSQLAEIVTIRKAHETAANPLVDAHMEEVLGQIQDEFPLKNPKAGDPSPLETLQQDGQQFYSQEQVDDISRAARGLYVEYIAELIRNDPELDVRSLDPQTSAFWAEKAKNIAVSQFNRNNSYIRPDANTLPDGEGAEAIRAKNSRDFLRQ